jgi:3-deoxy-D-manno-octulosonic-acid transferase
MWLIYFALNYLYVFAVRIAALNSVKAARWIEGRKSFPTFNIPAEKKVVWMHCASLGEFEQGRPVIEKLRQEFPGVYLVLSFFSPSGYEIRKNYAGADAVCYLPADLPGHASRFIQGLQPDLVIFVKYEFWAGYLHELKKRNIPAYLISARFRPGQFVLSPAGGWIRSFLNAFKVIFTQDENSKKLISRKLDSKIVIAGDTRFDRVSENAAYPQKFPEIETLINQRIVFVAGSTWQNDEEVIFPLSNSPVFTIVAPHEITEKHLQQLKQCCPQPAVLYSEIKQLGSGKPPATLIIDNVGMLMSVYKIAHIAYVGGAFHKQLHNILEPAAMGIPVLFGPYTDKFPEAEELQKSGGGFSISNHQEFLSTFQDLINDSAKLHKAGKNAAEYVSKNRGAAELIMKELRPLFQSTQL